MVYLAGIDNGTTSTKGVMIKEDGAQLYLIGRAVKGKQVEGIEMVTGEVARQALETNMGVYLSIQRGGLPVAFPVPPDYKPDPKVMLEKLTR